ncbi:hypothetical protein B7R22_06690 [Subtercola boreus]|uniref:Uncharacterized protein n=1 Tax=Subtercola boreus TaxID=120213 RepID=A0A3E0W0K1_9MICO|nr:hypothetical protein [Subtercola boreus]RFA15510.1 hypothetical protein B7R22_06690 [Subtercola boreus]
MNAAGPDATDPALTTITVDATVPDEATLDGLAVIARHPGVALFSYDQVRPPDSQGDWRSTLVVATTTTIAKDDVVQHLSTFDTQAAPAAGTPRASYTVSSREEEIGSDVSGYLGLARRVRHGIGWTRVPCRRQDTTVACS